MTSAVTIACVVSAAVAFAPVSAAAAPRYASPTGADGASCAQNDPCSFTTAINGALDHDEVIVAPGHHTASSDISTNSDINVHGVAGQPRPVLTTTGLLALGSQQSALSDLEIDSTRSLVNAVTVSGQSVDRVVVKATPATGGVSACLFDGANAVIRDTVCWGRSGDGSEADGINTQDVASDAHSTLRNVTAMGTTGGGYGVYAAAHGTATHTLTVVNSIVRGAGSDFTVGASGSASFVGTTSHTNYATVNNFGGSSSFTDDGTKQTAAPLFADAANGDFHEQPGSPTVDAGANAAENGPTDADGVPRTVHGTTDIGAFELRLPPGVRTDPATARTVTGATLNGSVNPNGALTSYHFEYGKTATYGRSSPAVNAGAGGDAVAASAALTGLRPNTRYHYRLVATNALGTGTGVDRTFKTAPDPFRGLRIPKQTAEVDGRRARVRVRCPANAAGRCRGKLKLTAKDSASLHGARRITLGSRKFNLRSGQTRKLRVKLSSHALDLLGQLGQLKARAQATARDSFGTKRKTTRKATLKPRG